MTLTRIEVTVSLTSRVAKGSNATEAVLLFSQRAGSASIEAFANACDVRAR